MEEKHSEETVESTEEVTSEESSGQENVEETVENTEEVNSEENTKQPEAEINYRLKINNMSDKELQDLFKKAQESSQYVEMLQRTKADYENYRKRQERDRATFLKYANQEILKQLLGAVDSLQRAIDTGKQAQVDSGFFEGICLVQKELEKTLQDNNVKEIEAKGQTFNPNYHEAVSQIESADHPEMTVIEAFDKGYIYHDRVLRPSKVVVSKKPQAAQENSTEH